MFNTFFFICLIIDQYVTPPMLHHYMSKQYFGVHLNNLSDLKACVLIIITSVLHFLVKAPTGLCVHLSRRYRTDSRHGVQSVSVEVRDFLVRTQWPDTHKAAYLHTHCDCHGTPYPQDKLLTTIPGWHLWRACGGGRCWSYHWTSQRVRSAGQYAQTEYRH